MSDGLLAGQFTFPGTSLTIWRIGYGVMQLAGPGLVLSPQSLAELDGITAAAGKQ